MDTIYLICAVAGGTFLGIQALLLLFGFSGEGADVDGAGGVDADAGMDSALDAVDSGEGQSAAATAHAFQVISTKTLTAFFTFFGLGGLLGGSYGVGPVPAVALALGCGLVAVFVVAYLWSALYKLQSRGNVEPRRAVGKLGRVYLRVPANGEGHGKVTVAVQGRTLELAATTSEQAIPTGTIVRVVAMSGPESVRVARTEPTEGGVS